MKKIRLSNDHRYFTVDDEDYERVKDLTWTCGNGNIFTWYLDESISIGKFLLKTISKSSELISDPSLIVDHRDRNYFNNRRENLRVATVTQNNCNRIVPRNKKYRGVRKTPSGKFRVEIKSNGWKRHIGTYSSEECAAKVYDNHAIDLFGEFAVLNFNKE